jgi:hypothetical protein
MQAMMWRLTIIGIGLLFVRDVAGQSEPYSIPRIPAAKPSLSWEPMPDALRSEVVQLVVVASDAAARDSITGDYEKGTPGFSGGVTRGADMGNMSAEIGGVNVNFPVPILQLPGAVYGGVSGAMEREVQEFRDELTEELADTDTHPLSNSGLALDVFQNLAALPGLKAKLVSAEATIPESTDAILFVRFSDFSIFVEKDEAVLTVSAEAEMRRKSDGTVMYKRMMQYQDRGTLDNWTENDRALWHDYANFAAHHLARELSAQTFAGIIVPHELVPEESASVRRDRKDERRFVSKTWNPALAWSFELGDTESPGAAPSRVADAEVLYDVEIYDNHRLVYSKRRLAETTHVVAAELEPCTVYRWSVRPSFQMGDEIAYGEWMRLAPDSGDAGNGRSTLVGRNASIAPAYTQDFPQIKTRCGRR